MLSVPFLLTTTYFTSPLLHPPPILPPLDILSHYKAWFGSLVCVHVVPLCKRPRLKLCGKSSASFLNTPGITVQGLRRERGGQREWKEGVEERSRGQIEVLREERLLKGGRGKRRTFAAWMKPLWNYTYCRFEKEEQQKEKWGGRKGGKWREEEEKKETKWEERRKRMI